MKGAYTKEQILTMFTSFTQENREDYAKQLYDIAQCHFLRDNQSLLDYIYDFAWHYGRLFHIGDAEKIKAAVSEKFKLPEEYLKPLNHEQ